MQLPWNEEIWKLYCFIQEFTRLLCPVMRSWSLQFHCHLLQLVGIILHFKCTFWFGLKINHMAYYFTLFFTFSNLNNCFYFQCMRFQQPTEWQLVPRGYPFDLVWGRLCWVSNSQCMSHVLKYRFGLGWVMNQVGNMFL